MIKDNFVNQHHEMQKLVRIVPGWYDLILLIIGQRCGIMTALGEQQCTIAIKLII